MPQHSSSAFPGRVLQERSPNVQADSQPQSRRPLQRIVIQSAYEGRECILTNKAGDHVIKHADFYQLTAEERRLFIWLRARSFQVPRYVKYRKGSLEKPRGKEARWEDVREDLFFKALVKFPPMWRDKRPYKPFETPNTTYGRNEHIAFYLNDILGYVSYKKLQPVVDGETIRKQVSSHLQVLKGYFKGEPDLLRWMASEVKSDKPKRTSSDSERMTRRLTRQPYPPLRRIHSASAQSLPEPSTVLPSQGCHAALSVSRSPEFFRMFLSQDSHPMHIYTQWQKHNASPYDLGRTPKSTWLASYPLLESILGEVNDDCTLLSAESSLHFPDVDMVYDGKNLDIEFSFKCQPIFLKQNSFLVVTDFSTHGIDLNPQPHRGYPQKCLIDFERSSLGVPFASEHWKTILYNYALIFKQALTGLPGGFQDPEYLKRKARAQIEAELQNLTAVQKVYRRSLEAEDDEQNIVLMIYWKFRLTKPNEIGTTSFREFIRPASCLTPDLWANHDLQLRLAKREESSFAIKDEMTSFDNSFGLPYDNYNLKLEDQPSYSFNIHTNAPAIGYSSYGTPELSQVYDDCEYGVGALADPPSPVDMSGSDTESDMGEFTQMTHDEYNMFDHTGLSHLGGDHASQPLLDPGAGLALGLTEHLSAYDPVLVDGGLSGETHMAHDFHHQMHILPQQDMNMATNTFGVHSLANPGRAELAFGMNRRTPVTDHEPTHFHHYHRLPRLVQVPHGHFSQSNTPDIHTPIQDGSLEPDLVLATPWIPEDSSQGTENHHIAGTSQHDGLLHPLMPRLFRHDSDTTISIKDMTEFDLAPSSHSAVVYAQAQPMQLYHHHANLEIHDDHAQLITELERATKNSFELNEHSSTHPEQHITVTCPVEQAKDFVPNASDGHEKLHEAVDVVAEHFDDADWELLPRADHVDVNDAAIENNHDDSAAS